MATGGRAAPTRQASAQGALSRRAVLHLGAGLAAAGMLGRPASPAAARVVAGGGGQPFREPAVRASRDGLLSTSLTARMGPATVGGRAATTTVYDGIFPGPTLRVRPGDRLRLALTNALDEPTNFHTHGLHVSPQGNSDNVLMSVAPGQRFEFQFDLPPDHPAGLYWYHPHPHKYSDAQVFGGMAGALVIEGDLDALPGIAGVPERLLVLQAILLDQAGRVQPGDEFDANPFMRLVNGQLQPTLHIQPGETQRWRIANAAADTYFLLELAGHPLHQIAADGNTLDAVWTRDQILLPPGKRVEVLIQGGSPGVYELRTRSYNRGTGLMGSPTEPDALLATLVSEGPAMAPRPLPTSLLLFVDLRQATVDRRRELVFQQPMNQPMGTFWIDGHAFDPDRIDQTVQLGATEEWVIRNTSDQVHPFHIHVNPFQVVAVNGEAVTSRGYEDTVNISREGSITMRTRFLDYPGKSVYHCHILMHEDGGMMGIVDIVE